jgi:transporter family-2 protein
LKNTILIGTTIALITGVIAGLQATISSKVGTMIGPMRTGIFTNVIGGFVGLVVLCVWLIFFPRTMGNLPKPAMLLMLVSGTMALVIIMGVSFSLSQAGVAAGLAAIILGQMVVSLFVDSAGLGGTQPIPITMVRVAGLLVVALGVYMLLPRS